MKWPWTRTRREIEALETELATVKNQATAADTEAIFSDWIELFGNHFRSIAGPVVTAESAMRSSTVFACVGLISDCVSNSPCLTYKGRYGVKGERQPAWDHPRARQLRLEPNPGITASIFWKFISQSKLLSGNGYALIRSDRLIPLKPGRVTVYQAWEIAMDQRLGVDPFRLYYYVLWDNGKFEVFDQDDMLHFPNLGWDGKQGLSTIQAGTQNIGLALAQEEHGAKFYGQGANYNVVLKWPSKVSPDTAKNITDAYLRKRQSYRNQAEIPLILEQGGDISNISMSARDAQALEARQYSAIDQCKWFGVPPIMVGESEKQSSWGTGIAEVMRWFVMRTLNTHYTDIEQELERKLFGTGRFFAEFDETELTRGDLKSRGEYYRIARGNSQEPGFMSVEEIRIEEGLAPTPKQGELQKPTVGGVPNAEPNPATSKDQR